MEKKGCWNTHAFELSSTSFARLKITLNFSVVITVIISNTTIDYLVSDGHVSIALRYVSYFLDVVLF
jgi:hypothetical protein